MFKMYSKKCEYALCVLTEIPINQIGKSFVAFDLCLKAKLPLHSTRKSLQILVNAGLLEAVSGPGGGYKFKKDPVDISLLEIIKSIDGPHAFDQCVMGLKKCDHNNSCPVHTVWLKVKGKMETEMKNKTLYELMTIRRKR